MCLEEILLVGNYNIGDFQLILMIYVNNIILIIRGF